MKKAILLLGFLVGCAPGLNATRIEGISTYTNTSGKLEEARAMVDADKDFQKSPYWKRVDGVNTVALIELKSAIAKAGNAELVDAIKYAKYAGASLKFNHLKAIYRVFTIRKSPSVIDVEKQRLAKYGLENDPTWLAASGQFEVALALLVEASYTDNEKVFNDRAIDVNKAITNVFTVSRKLLDEAMTKEACSHVSCPNNTVCQYSWRQIYCLDKTGESVKPVHIEGFTDVNGVVHPGGSGTGDSLNKGPVPRQ